MIKSDKTYHPIAKVTKTSGLKGDVRLKPLSRFFDEYISDNSLMIGFSLNKANKIIIEMINGIGKKRKFKFFGLIHRILQRQLLVRQFLFRHR